MVVVSELPWKTGRAGGLNPGTGSKEKTKTECKQRVLGNASR